MSQRLLKCYGYCNKTYPKEELVKVSNQNHCKPCAEKKENDKKDREELYKTIQLIYKIPYPNGQMLRQIKQFGEERNYTLKGMTMTLCYFVKVIKKVPFINGGLSFLPYHYDSALKYYADLEEKRKNAKDVDNNIKVMKIPPIKHSTNFFREKRIIKMEAALYDK